MISATIRDIAIILVAIEILVMNALLVVLVWQVWRLIKLVQTEIKPIIKDGQETVGTVKGTADFVSNSIVNPLMTASSRWAGFRRSVRVMQTELRSSMAAVAPARPAAPPSTTASRPGTPPTDAPPTGPSPADPSQPI